MSRLALWFTLCSAVSATLTFEHLGSTWTIHAHDNELHVTGDCPEDMWCGFGFNKDAAQMAGADVFTFGHHQGTDLPDCPMTCGTGCGCGCGTRRLSAPKTENPFIPRVRDLKIQLPKPFTTPGAAHKLDQVGGVVGVAMNSVLFVNEHPEEGMTWLFDNCGGHGDTYGHYHYHAPPLCLLKSLGVPVPKKSAWWKSAGAAAWPEHGPEVQIGWALDGAPIMGPFKGGVRTEKKLLDECHGAFDELTGEYRYYLLPSAPYMPPCLRGAQLGNVSSFRSRKDGEPCSKSESHSMQTSIMAGGKLLTGTGCPEHAMFKDVHRGLPFGLKGKLKGKTARRLGCGCGCGANKYGTCPSACGCGCGCGCGATCGCGCGTTTTGCGCGATCGCGCGTTTTGCGCGATCGCGCGTSTTGCGCGTTCGCGCGTSNTTGCGCGTTCGCGCGTTCGCGCGTACGCGCGCGTGYQCKGQMFCHLGMTKNTSAMQPVSLSQCNLHASSPPITIDDKQDFSEYSLTFENGRMKVSAHRAFNTGDPTDYVLDMDTQYYVLLTVGQSIKVGYHGNSRTQTLVCVSTLSTKGECKLASDWTGPPGDQSIQMSSSTLSLFGVPLLLALARVM